MDSTPDFSSWPPILQWLAAFGAAIAGGVAWWIGHRDKKPNGSSSLLLDEIRKAINETGDQAAARARDHAKLELRLVLNEELGELRQDTERALSATRKSLYDRIERVASDQQALRERVIRLETSIGRRRQ